MYSYINIFKRLGNRVSKTSKTNKQTWKPQENKEENNPCPQNLKSSLRFKW